MYLYLSVVDDIEKGIRFRNVHERERERESPCLYVHSWDLIWKKVICSCNVLFVDWVIFVWSHSERNNLELHDPTYNLCTKELLSSTYASRVIIRSFHEVFRNITQMIFAGECFLTTIFYLSCRFLTICSVYFHCNICTRDCCWCIWAYEGLREGDEPDNKVVCNFNISRSLFYHSLTHYYPRKVH